MRELARRLMCMPARSLARTSSAFTLSWSDTGRRCGRPRAHGRKQYRRVALQEHAAADTLVDDGAHTLAVVNNADVVHDLGNANNVVHVQQLADFPAAKNSAPAFSMPGKDRDARRSEHVLAELGLFRILKHEGALETHDVADLVRVGADESVPADRAGKIFRGSSSSLSMCICVSM